MDDPLFATCGDRFDLYADVFATVPEVHECVLIPGHEPRLHWDGRSLSWGKANPVSISQILDDGDTAVLG